MRNWATDHDWRKSQAKLNALPQFTTEIDGLEPAPHGTRPRKGLDVDDPLSSDSRFLAAKAAEEAAAVKQTVARGKLPAY